MQFTMFPCMTLHSLSSMHWLWTKSNGPCFLKEQYIPNTNLVNSVTVL
jgi:hypothetical protein